MSLIPNSKKELDEKKDKEGQKSEDEILDPDLLDNYEFNNLEYEQASEYDRRSCGRTYISVNEYPQYVIRDTINLEQDWNDIF